MKFICRWCGKEIERDMRYKQNRDRMKKRGFLSFCDEFGKSSYLQPVAKKRKIHK